LSTLIFAVSGLFWAATYVLIIRKSFRDKVYGMPLVALCGNLSWEFIYSVLYPEELVYGAMFGIGFLLDIVIAWTVMRFGPAQFQQIPKPVFYAGIVATLALAATAHLAVSEQLQDPAGRYTAFIDNLMMSALFLGMLYQRRSLAGQSISIAACKLVGTAMASVHTGLLSPAYAGSPLLLFLYVGCFILDVAYLIAVLAVRRATTVAGGPQLGTVGPAAAATDHAPADASAGHIQ
jgi:hypothetical protein